MGFLRGGSAAAGIAVRGVLAGCAAPGPPAAQPAVTVETAASASEYETRLIAGFTLEINRAFIEQDPALLDRVLVQLHADLNEMEHFLPAAAAESLRGVTVWVELQGYRGMGHGGHGLCCHWSPSWLVENGLPAEK